MCAFDRSKNSIDKSGPQSSALAFVVWCSQREVIFIEMFHFTFLKNA